MHAPQATRIKRSKAKMDSTLSPPYLLSNRAHVCVAYDAVFILDSKNGKYLSIAADKAAGLSSFILDWPIEPRDRPAAPLLQSLIDRCLVTSDPALGKPATPPSIKLPNYWLCEGQPRGWPDISVTDFCKFSMAIAYALFSKKFLPFKHTLARMEKRKRANKGDNIDPQQLASLVRKFDWLRPLGFKKKDECFLYCLALSEFLAKYNIYPNWIFEIRSAQPFEAHCWLQYGDQALTDLPFRLRRMVPILVL
jgi:hypothetical protein